MRIIQFTAENVKKLKAVTIRPDGSVILITGANGAGKSSVLDAIFYALAGTKFLPSQPVRHGEEKAFVKLDLGDIVVTRRFTANGGTSLSVEAASGAKFPSPQRMLDDLLGALAFDPLEFARMAPKAQLETLRGLVHLDVDCDALDAANKVDYDRRTELNRTLLRKTAERGLIPRGLGLPNTVSEPIDVADLARQLQEAYAYNEDAAHQRRYRGTQADRAAELRNSALQALKQAEEIDEKLAALPSVPEHRDVDELTTRIKSAKEVNASIEAHNRTVALNVEILNLEEQIQNYSIQMETRTRNKRNAIVNAKMPVEGLSFGDGEIVFNGIPFAQISSAEQLRVSVAVAMAANPKLRILRIKDGSLLDEANLALLEWLAEENNFQVWIERVDTTGKVGIMIEDGSVVEG